MTEYDLLLTGGRLIDPSQKIDAIKDVAFKAGKVVDVKDKFCHQFTVYVLLLVKSKLSNAESFLICIH